MRAAQNQNHTHLFRRTDALRTARAKLAMPLGGNLRILSFGCSTGEELVTLKVLFPAAELFGCDIDSGVLAVASRTAGHVGTIFESGAQAITSHGPFHLINCSSVLCLNPPTNIASAFPGSQFDDTLGILDAALVPGGLLIITNASYRLQDSPLAAAYDPVRSDIVTSRGFVDVFAHDGRPFLSRVPKVHQIIFRRGPAFAMRDPEEFADSVFCKRLPNARVGPMELRLARQPAHFVCDFEFHRSNLDGLSVAAPGDVVEVRKHYRFGSDADSGQQGCTVDTSWDCGFGAHRRPAAWFPLEELGGGDF